MELPLVSFLLDDEHCLLSDYTLVIPNVGDVVYLFRPGITDSCFKVKKRIFAYQEEKDGAIIDRRVEIFVEPHDPEKDA